MDEEYCMSEQRQICLGSDHANLLHDAGRGGDVIVAQKSPDGWYQYPYPVADLPAILPFYDGLTNIYITQARFRKRRCVSLLREVGALLESSLDVPDDRLCAGVQDADYIEAGLLEDGLALGYVLLGYGPDSPLLAWRHGLGGISEGGAPTQLDLHEDHTASVT